MLSAELGFNPGWLASKSIFFPNFICMHTYLSLSPSSSPFQHKMLKPRNLHQKLQQRRNFCFNLRMEVKKQQRAVEPLVGETREGKGFAGNETGRTDWQLSGPTRPVASQLGDLVQDTCPPHILVSWLVK